MAYNAETYWSHVGQEIQKRAGDNVIAGDDNPYFAYKRSKFQRRFLDTIDFQSKTIIEVGCGPGGNLRHIAACHRPRLILGADISQTMYDIAQRNLRSYGNVKLAICRLTRDTIIIMEDIGDHEQVGGEGTAISRTVEVYRTLFVNHGFQLRHVEFLNTKVSRSWYEFAWCLYRRVFGNRHEGDQINPAGRLLIGLPLTVTRIFDDLRTEEQNLANRLR